MTLKPIELVRNYHERTKHKLDGYARGPEFLDWDQQPDPFRRFAGAGVTELPLLPSDATADEPGYQLATVAALLELSLGLSVWKQFGADRWALRCNPSSGNLHPTEGYVIATAIDGIENGVYHYAPREHALEQRGIAKNSATAPQLLIGLSSIMWRESWKYGERAFRYVQLDTGHALGAIRYAAEVMGLQVTLLDVSDDEISHLLGIDRDVDFTGAEKEHPDLLLQIHINKVARPVVFPVIDAWNGSANPLGRSPHPQWEIIDKVAAATRCDSPMEMRRPRSVFPEPLPRENRHSLTQLIRQRRSAQAFISMQSTLSLNRFYRILDALLPRAQQAPLDVWRLPCLIHPVLFVHRVEELPPGLYAFPRRDEAREKLKAAMNQEFNWEKPQSCPPHLPLYQLLQADAQEAARTISCHQEIASSSAFSLGMLAEFESGLSCGPCGYRRMYWEAGLLGQILYLEAEAADIRGTGIGCFFDDNFHQLLGLEGTEFQSLYHFTVGMPAIDTRLEDLPPYSHLSRAASHD